MFSFFTINILTYLYVWARFLRSLFYAYRSKFVSTPPEEEEESTPTPPEEEDMNVLDDTLLLLI